MSILKVPGILTFFLFFTLTFPSVTFGDFSLYIPPALSELWNAYAAQESMVSSAPDGRGRILTPGRHKADADEHIKALFSQPWSFRSSCYEIIMPDNRFLAPMIFNLARHAKDIDYSITAERFYKAVQGFHYSVTQICAWLNDVESGNFPPLDSPGLVLVTWLKNDQIIIKQNGRWGQAGIVSHVLGVAPGKRRTLEQNLAHERAHVFWDEDPEVQKNFRAKWQAMTAEELKAVREKLKIYAHNPEQLFEEWAVGIMEKRLQTSACY